MHNQATPDRDAIAELVLDNLREVLETTDPNALAGLNVDAALVGPSAILDSLNLVRLIVNLEQRIEEEYDLPLTVASDRAMSMRNSPFRSPRTLTDYICSLVAEEGQND